jgi:hypothetical protein
MGSLAENIAFLDNLYRKGPFAGHGFMAQPPFPPLYEGLGDYTLSALPVREWLPDIVAHYETQVRWLAELGDHSVPMANLGTGTQLYAAAFGCPVHTYPDTNPAALPLVHNSAQADQLAQPDVWKCRGLYRVFELGEAVRQELGSDAYLGPPDIQTGFDTAALVWNKQDFFIAMKDEPEAVHRLVDKCAGLLRAFLAELRGEFPTMVPGHCPRAWVPTDLGWWVSNDECGAFGTDLFREFCLPELGELARTFGSVGMHCCADAEHQFEVFAEIPNFYAFNRVAGKLGWDSLLEHFNGPDSPVHVLGWVDPAQIARFLEQAHPATRFIFVHGGVDLEDARRWLGEVRG